MARVSIIFPDGESGDIEEGELPAALAQGFRLPSDEQNAASAKAAHFDAPIAAGLLSTARALTFGASDRFLVGAGGDDKKATKAEILGLQEANPAADVGGEVIGTIASAFIPGGAAAKSASAPGLIARLGVGAERLVARGLGEAAEGVAGKALSKAAGGAAEGAAFGVQQSVTDAYLQDKELTAEQLISSVGLNALLGGGLGGGLGAAGAGVKKLTTADPAKKEILDAILRGAPEPTPGAAGAKAAPEAAAEGIDEFAAKATRELEDAATKNAPLIQRTIKNVVGYFPDAEELVLRDLDFKKAAIRNLREKGLIESAPRALLDDPRYAAAKTPEAKIELLGTKKKEALDSMLGTAKKLDAAAEPDELISTLNLAAKLDEELIAPLKKAGNANAAPIKQLEAWSEDLLSRGEYMTMSEADEFKRLLDPHLKWDSGSDSIVRAKLQQFRGTLNGEIEATARKISKRAFGGEDVAGQWKKSKRLFGEMAELLGEGEERLVDAKNANRFFSLTDNIAGTAGGAVGMLMSGPAGIALAAASALANKWGRERLPHIMALALDRHAKNPSIAKAADRLAQTIKSAPEGSLGTHEAALRAAAARGGKDAAAAHVALSQTDDAYKAVADKAGLHAFTEAVVTDGASQKVWERVQAAADGLVGKVPGRQAAMVGASGILSEPFLPSLADGKEPKDRNKQFARRIEEIARLSSNPELLTDALASSLQGMPEDAKGAVAERMARAVAFLSSKAPKQPADSPFPSLQRSWRPSDADISAFERYMGAINDPLSVMDNLKQGRVTREAVEALQAVYPKMYGDIRTAVAERLGDAHNRIGYNQRLSLGVLFGVPTTPELEPDYLQLLQAAPQQAGGSGPSSAPSGKPYNADNGLAPASERLLRKS